MRDVHKVSRGDPLIAGGAAGAGLEELEGDAAVGYCVSERADERGTGWIDAHGSPAEERRVAVGEMEHGGHQLPRLTAHQHAPPAVDDEIKRDAQLERDAFGFRARELFC